LKNSWESAAAEEGGKGRSSDIFEFQLTVLL
jgi:hypothetical protein